MKGKSILKVSFFLYNKYEQTHGIKHELIGGNNHVGIKS